MKHVLGAAALAAVALVAGATPAAAAPPEHTVDSGCIEDVSSGSTYCFTVDQKVKYTLLPNGNEHFHASGTSSFVVTSDDGFRFGGSTTFSSKYLFKQGEPHVNRYQVTETSYVGDSSCTDVTYYKFTNGRVQVSDFDRTCNF